MLPTEVNDDLRFSPEGNRNYDIKRLWSLHLEIARRNLLGQKATHIARDLAISPQTVSNVSNSVLFKRQLSIMRAARDADSIDIAKRIKEVAPKAIDLLEKSIEDDLLKEDTSQVGLRAATAVLDHSIPRKVEGTLEVGGHMTVEDITRIKNNAISAGMVPEDVDFEEITDGKEDSDES